MKNFNKFIFFGLLINFSNSVAQDYSDKLGSKVLAGDKNKTYLSVFGGSAFAGNKLDYLIKKSPAPSNLYGIGAGYYINDNVRIELNLSQLSGFKYRVSRTEDDMDNPEYKVHFKLNQTIKSTLIMANLYYDFKNQTSFIPYITGGIGVARNKAGTYYQAASNDSVEKFNPAYYYNAITPGRVKNDFAWNIGAGISYRANDHFIWDIVNYKYNHLGKFSTKNTSLANNPSNSMKSKLSAHSVTSGIRIQFDLFK
jgi:opacity protein-like surface antigen